MKTADLTTQFKYRTEMPIRFSDMDMFGHVNNAVYLTYFEQARSSYWREIINWDWEATGVIVAKAEVDYIKPIMPNEKIFAYVKTSRIGNSSWDIEYLLVCEKENGELELKTKGRTVQVAMDYKTQKPTATPDAERNAMMKYDGLG